MITMPRGGAAALQRENEAAELRAQIPDSMREALWLDFKRLVNWTEMTEQRVAGAYQISIKAIRAERRWWTMNGKPTELKKVKAEALPLAPVTEMKPATEPVPPSSTELVAATSLPVVGQVPEPEPQPVEDGMATRTRQTYNWPSDDDLLARLQAIIDERGTEWGAQKRLADELQIPSTLITKRLQRIREERDLAGKGNEPAPAPVAALQPEEPALVVPVPAEPIAEPPALEPAPIPEEVQPMLQQSADPAPIPETPIPSTRANDVALDVVRAMSLTHDGTQFKGAELQTIIERATAFYQGPVLVMATADGLKIFAAAE